MFIPNYCHMLSCDDRLGVYFECERLKDGDEVMVTPDKLYVFLSQFYSQLRHCGIIANLWLKPRVQSAVKSIFKSQRETLDKLAQPSKSQNPKKLFFFCYLSQWAVLFSLCCHSVNCESSQDPTADTSRSALCHRILSDKTFCVFQITASSSYIHLLLPIHQFFFSNRKNSNIRSNTTDP